MLWVIQQNLHKEYGYDQLVNTIQRLQFDHVFVNPVPFTNSLVDVGVDLHHQDVDDLPLLAIDNTQPIIVMGSTTLTRIAQHNGWSPGSYINDNFDFSVWNEKYGEHTLNHDAVVCTFADVHTTIPNDGGDLFVRPTLDNKSFSGMLTTASKLYTWSDQIAAIVPDEFTPLHRDTEIVIAPVKHISGEYRLFVVDGKIVTGSRYKLGSVVAPLPLDQCSPLIVEFAQPLIDAWVPAEAFVIDIADCGDCMKVVEINNINSAGFYHSDVSKLVQALAELNESN